MQRFSLDTPHNLACALRQWGIRAFSAAAVALVSNVVSASTIIDRANVEQALQRGALLWDVRAPADYQKGHVPGAVSIGDAPAVLRDANREDFISVAAIERILGGAGIDPSREIVVYGNRHVEPIFWPLHGAIFRRHSRVGVSRRD